MSYERFENLAKGQLFRRIMRKGVWRKLPFHKVITEGCTTMSANAERLDTREYMIDHLCNETLVRPLNREEVATFYTQYPVFRKETVHNE